MSNEKEFWIDNFDKGYYDKIILKGLALKRGLQSNWHNCTYKYVKQKISADDLHLDYACGSGTFIGRYLYSNSIGVDISDSQIEYARQTFQKKDKFFTVQEFESLSKKNFDIVSVLGLIEFLDENENKELLKKINNLLKENGKIILTTPNFSFLFRFIQTLSKTLGVKDYGDVTISNFKFKNLEKLLMETGFNEIKIKKIVNLGILPSIFSHKLGLIVENLIGKIFSNCFGFILIAEAKKN